MDDAGRLRSWLRDHPLAVDATVAAVVALITLFVPHPDTVVAAHAPTLADAVVAVACAALVVRRVAPLPVLGVTIAAYVAGILLGGFLLHDGLAVLPLARGRALHRRGARRPAHHGAGVVGRGRRRHRCHRGVRGGRKPEPPASSSRP